MKFSLCANYLWSIIIISFWQLKALFATQCIHKISDMSLISGIQFIIHKRKKLSIMIFCILIHNKGIATFRYIFCVFFLLTKFQRYVVTARQCDDNWMGDTTLREIVMRKTVSVFCINKQLRSTRSWLCGEKNTNFFVEKFQAGYFPLLIFHNRMGRRKKCHSFLSFAIDSFAYRIFTLTHSTWREMKEAKKTFKYLQAVYDIYREYA